ncbi:MAG TPA: sodium:proton antiporter [Porphyromonadaceae bacterium]|nr:sodium:proton antiporter [Porphyromonadaceae bacterium]
MLGYIIAGFLASPNFHYLPSISNLENIEVWAQVGIVVIMFTLGLEFSYKKLINSGSSAIITALIIITGMTFAGFGVGRLLHLDTINCIFLGGMISMSSTTIILKALTDLGLRQKKFASMVLALLIIEDLFAVLMLVLLSSIAVGTVESSELLFAVGKLVFFLIIWFVVGVYVLPSFLSKARSMLNDETLLVCSLGLCFAMAIFSVMCGFSLELGAFVLGSILAGTMAAERIEKVVKPVKDLFGAVFFISVGMMVQPEVIAQYWGQILLLAVVVIAGMILFGTIGMLVTGQTLKVALQSGFTLTQVGEFSFIIASLGMSLGVLEASLYPIIVAVSVITIFTTPYFIKMADPVYGWVEKHLPERMRSLLTRYSAEQSEADDTRGAWKEILVSNVSRIVLYSVILIAIILVSRQYIDPLCAKYLGESTGKIVCVAASLLVMAPFIFALTRGAVMSPQLRKSVSKDDTRYQVPVIAMRIIRCILGLLFLVAFVSFSYTSTIGWIVGVVAFLLIALFASKSFKTRYDSLEQKFIDNLNIRENTRFGTNNNIVDDLHQAYIEVSPNSPFVGDRLRDSGLRKDFGVSISSIQRGHLMMPLPSSDARIFPGDILGVIGTDDQIKHLNDELEHVEKAYTKLDVKQPEVSLRSIRLTASSPIIGKPLAQTNIREDYYCIIVKVQRADGEFVNPQPDTVLHAGDLIWVVGDESQFKKMK